MLSALDTDLAVSKVGVVKNRAQANPEGSQPLAGGWGAARRYRRDATTNRTASRRDASC